MANQKNSSCLFYLFFILLIGVGGYFIRQNYFSNPKSKAEAKKSDLTENILVLDSLCIMLQMSSNAKAGYLVDKGFIEKIYKDYSYDKWGMNYVLMENIDKGCRVLFSTDAKIDYFHIAFSKERKDVYLKFLRQFPNIKAEPYTESDTLSVRKISNECMIRAAGYMREGQSWRVVVYQPKKEIEVKNAIEAKEDIKKPKKKEKELYEPGL